LYFGTIHHDQGAKEAIEIARLAEKKLILAGVVHDSIYFEHNVEPYVDGDRVVYAGAVSAEKRSELMGGARAMLHPINFDEPFGLAVAESLACGTPVIAFDRGSMSEIVDHGETGFLALNTGDAADKIKRIGEIDRRQCRRRVEEKFSAEKMVAGYLNAYKQALERNRKEERRPWGYYQVLANAPDHKIKRIVIFPGRRLSLQRHAKRAEHWLLIHGEALVTRDDDSIPLTAGYSIDIFPGTRHRIENTGAKDLVFIEVQTGAYFGEDDIERFEDDYGRIGKS
jgi:mannose-6-phosphate isomerase-like protein (cupin superfamily)